jgi:hypothetical protein
MVLIITIGYIMSRKKLRNNRYLIFANKMAPLLKLLILLISRPPEDLQGVMVGAIAYSPTSCGAAPAAGLETTTPTAL